MIDITFIRHGETEGNAAGIWQGHGDSELSTTGRRQADALGRRLATHAFTHVVSSDLGRATATAAGAGLDPEADPAWREVDIGEWEGLSGEDVHARYPQVLAALADGEDVRLGDGETWSEFGARVDDAVERLVGRCDDGDRIAVVTHGGVIHSVVSGLLGFRDRPQPWPIERLSNTSLTVLRIDEHGRHLLTLNDARHVRSGPAVGDDTVVGLIRHGETVANVEGRWAGLTDAPLTDEGRRQAGELPTRYDGARHVYSSPLVRSLHTAQAFADAHGLDVTVLDDLHEIDFGSWENMTSDEISARFPEEWHRVYVEGIDGRRGGTGETGESAAARFRAALSEIGDRHPGDRVAVVAHGGVIRAFVGAVVGIGHAERHRLALPANTSVSHVRMGRRVVLADYNLGAVS